jgi:hypothetical protein
MNRLYLIFPLLLLTSFKIFAQKLYIWCPEQQATKQHIGFLANQTVNLVVFDGRNIPSNSRSECSTSDLEQALKMYIQQIYPSCKIDILSDSAYYQSSAPGKITIKIDVNVGIGTVGGHFAYGVFPKGEWNGLVSYYVQIFDNRNAPGKKNSKEISVITSKSNLWGYKTAKTCLFASYDQANQQLLSFIENSLMD